MKLKDLDLFPSSSIDNKDLIWLSKYESGNEGASGTYTSYRLDFTQLRSKIGSGTADSTTYLRGDGSWATISVGGIWGISNSSGIYTYYATLTLAMASAVSGNVIEMFADVTETNNVSITLKDGVNINGNGHTYKYTNINGHCFNDGTFPNNGTCRIINLNVLREASTSNGHILYSTSNSNFDLSGSFFNYNITTPGSFYAINCTNYAYVKNANCKSTGSAIVSIGSTYNSYGESTASGTGLSSALIVNCIGISVSGRGISAYTNGSIYNSIGISTSGTGLYGVGALITANCNGISSSGIGLDSSARVENCKALSSSNVAINSNNSGTFYNCTAVSNGNNVCNTWAISLYNCYCETTWNNTSGHAIVRPVQVVGCTIKVANVSAYCLSYSASSVKYSNNSFIGSTTAVNPAITQGITNTQDSQGNILL